MTAVDFCERGPWAREWYRAMRRLHDAGAALRIWGVLCVVVASVIALELSRLDAALSDASRVEQRRDALAERVSARNKTATSVAHSRTDLLNMLVIRRNAVLNAAAIVRIGNAASPNVALTALRHLPDGFAIEGKTKEISDVGLTLRRLASVARESRTTFELRRENGSSGAVTFEIAVRTSSDRASL